MLNFPPEFEKASAISAKLLIAAEEKPSLLPLAKEVDDFFIRCGFYFTPTVVLPVSALPEQIRGKFQNTMKGRKSNA